jgi:hypothetical protein
MTEATDLERTLVRDLESLGDRLADEEFCTELYRALTNRVWRRSGGPDGHVSLSWREAEEIVNELRRAAGREALELAQTGGEGEVSATVGAELERLGWTSQPLNTGRHDDAHVEQAKSPPPADQGDRDAPVEDSRGWEREAHREAEEARLRTGGPPATQGEHAGGGNVPGDKA